MSLSSFFTDRPAPTPPARRRIEMRRRLIGRGKGLRTLSLAAGVLSLGIAFGQPAQAATKNWNGETADWYSNPTFWTPSGFPGAGDDAANTFLAASMTLGATGQSATVQSFVSNSAFTLEGGVTFSGSLSNDASILQINNIFTINGGQVNNFTINQGVQQTNQPAPTVVVTSNGSNSINNSVVNAGLDMKTNNTAFLNFVNKNTVNGTINLGTTNAAGAGLQVQDGNATLTLSSTGSLVGFGNVFQSGGNAVLTNNGLINATGGTLSLGLTFFTNNGTMEAMGGGMLTLANTFTTNTGALTANGAGSVVSITGTFTGSGTAASGNLITALNTGQVQVNGAALRGTINTDANTALIFNGSTTNNLLNTTVNGNLDLATNTNAFADFAGTNTVNGNISLGTTNTATNGNGRLDIQDGNANLILGSTGKNASLTGFGLVNQDGGNAQLTNTSTGTINANISGKTLNLAVTTFNNSGLAEATNGGTLALNNTNTNNKAGGTLAATGGGLLTVAGTLTSDAASTLNGVGGTVQINAAALRGTINGVGATTLIFNNSTSNNLLNTTVNANLNIANTSDAFADFAGTNTVNGNISLGTTNTTTNGTGPGRLDIQDGNANLILGSTGKNASLTGFGLVNQDGGNAQLTNTSTGTINANISGKTLNLAVTTFNNSGLAEATNGGTLALNNTNTNNKAGGTLAATGGGLLTVAGTLTSDAASTLNGVGGTVDVNAATLLGTINGVGATSLVFNNGNNLLNSGTYNVNLDLVTNKDAFVDFQGVNTVTKAITLGTTNTSTNGTGPGRLDIQDGNANLILSSTSSLTGFGLVNQDGGNATLTNKGLVNANSPTKPLTLGLTNFTNNGTAEATLGGTLSLQNTFTTNTGALTANGAGSVVSITGTFTGSGTAASGNLITALNTGQVQVNGAALRGTINTDANTALIFNGSTTNNLLNTTVNGNLDLATNTNAFADFAGTNTVNGNISLGTTNTATNGNGRLDIQDGNANLILGSTGKNASLTGFGLVNQDGGNAQLTNTSTGTINANISGKTLNLAVTTFNNSGLAEATNGGTLALNNTNSNNLAGSTLAATGPGSVVTIAGTFTGTGNNLITASGGGQVQVNGAALRGTINTDANTALVFNGSTSNNLLNTTVNGNLDLATNTNAFADFAGTNTVNGNISLGTTNTATNGNGRLDIQDGNANLILSSTGSLTGFGLVNQDGGNATLTNKGLVNANSVGNTLTLAQTNYTTSGTTKVVTGSTLTVASTSTIQTAGLTQVDGVLNLTNSTLALNGGALDGSGRINGNVNNSGGTVSPGDSPGTLAINGNYTQGSAGTLDIEFTNSAHDLLNVSGLVTTGGTLDVNYIDSAVYTGGTGPGSEFAFLDYGTLAASSAAAANDGFTVMGHDGFTYAVINDTAHNQLDLEVLTPGGPMNPVPEASTTVSFGLMLAMGLGGLVLRARAKKRSV